MSWLDIASLAAIGVVLILIGFTAFNQLVVRRNAGRGISSTRPEKTFKR